MFPSNFLRLVKIQIIYRSVSVLITAQCTDWLNHWIKPKDISVGKNKPMLSSFNIPEYKVFRIVTRILKKKNQA